MPRRPVICESAVWKRMIDSTGAPPTSIAMSLSLSCCSGGALPEGVASAAAAPTARFARITNM
jgi:hypothetical protein